MEHLRTKRILVTGASGFVGANLTRTLLRHGADVHAMVRKSSHLWRLHNILPELNVHVTDLLDSRKLQETVDHIRPQIVFHTAVSGVSHTQRDCRTILNANVLGTLNLLEATAKVDYERFVHTGSSTEYGVKKAPMKETDMLEPTTLFGMSKAAQTLLCQQVAKAASRPIVILRLFSVYGYWESQERLIPTVINAALHNQDITLTTPGYRRDYIFIEDVIEACLLVVTADVDSGEIINVGSGQQWANEDVVDIVQTLLPDCSSLVKAGGYPAHSLDTAYWVSDIQKARQLLGWAPKDTLTTGLKKTLSWFRHHETAYTTQRELR